MRITRNNAYDIFSSGPRTLGVWVALVMPVFILLSPDSCLTLCLPLLSARRWDRGPVKWGFLLWADKRFSFVIDQGLPGSQACL